MPHQDIAVAIRVMGEGVDARADLFLAHVLYH
jgi:hypothetical protein